MRESELRENGVEERELEPLGLRLVDVPELDERVAVRAKAWAFGPYKYPMDARNEPDGLLAAGIIAFKKELVYNGYDENIVVDLPFFGTSVRNRVKDFQAAQGLPVTGEIGYLTAKELFRKRVEAIERRHSLTRGTVGKKLQLESGWDPVAIGVADPNDTGIAQINLPSHPNVSRAEALRPDFAIPWSGDYIADLKKDVELRVDTLRAARAGYNIGAFYASLWLLSDYATSGGPTLGGQDVFVRATNYLAVVDKQDW